MEILLSSIAVAFRAAPVYAIYDTQSGPALPAREIVSAWLRAGIRVIQYRHKDTLRRIHFEECQELSELVHREGGIFIVDDRADLALFSNADGVHLGQDDLPPDAARKLLPTPAIIGFSTHNLLQIREAAAMPIDYLAVGPVYATATKANPDPVVGTGLVKEARKLTDLPLVAIGGMGGANASSVLKAGADAVAVISGLVVNCRTTGELETQAREILTSLRT